MPRRKDPRKTTVADQAGFLSRMVRGFVKRLAEQGTDPEHTQAALPNLVRLYAEVSHALAASGVNMTEVLAEYAKGEDPGVGLAALLDLAEAARDAADEVGFSLAEQIGTSQIADDLGYAGRPMRRQIADKRWGPAARARKTARKTAQGK